MAGLTIGRLPYWGIAILLAAITFGPIFLGFRGGLGLYSYIFLVIPVALAVWYMAEYARAMSATEPSPVPPTAPFPPEESFEDPVVEADLFDSLGEADQATVAAEGAPPSPP